MAEPVESQGTARKGLWAPTRGYFTIESKGGAAKAAGPKAPPKPKPAAAAAAAEAATGTAAATASGTGAAAATEPAVAASRTAVRQPPAASRQPAEAKPSAKAPPAPKKDPLRDSVTTVPALAGTAVGKTLAERVYDEPDSETTLYKVTALNVVFAVSSALLLGYTLLVMWQDYNRPWKNIQGNWQAELEKEYETELAAARAEQAKVFQGLVPALEGIVARVAGDAGLAAARAEAQTAGSPEGAVDAFMAAAQSGLDATTAYLEKKAAARKAEIDFTLEEKKLRAFKGDFQAEKFKYEEMKRHAQEEHGSTARGAEEIRKIEAEFAEQFVKELDRLDARTEELKAKWDLAKADLATYVKTESQAAGGGEQESLPVVEGRLVLMRREVDGVAKKITAVEKDWRTAIRNFPGIDFLAPTYQIQKVVVNDLHEDMNFLTVPRVDRCKTCHLNIDEPDPRLAGRESERWGSVYASHPRLDLFVGSSSPHPYETFGCTTCHYGDGHSTDFNYAAHIPSSEAEEHEWEKKYHYHRIHHQDYPMLEKKYVASSCFKCHPKDHRLDGGGNFNLGYEIVKTYGCYGCHKMKAFADFEKVGPNLAGIADKADLDFLYKWIRNPQSFRPTTRMPRFFDLTNSQGVMKTLGEDGQLRDLDFGVRNGVEVLAIATYLHETSRRREDLKGRPALPPGVAARGRELVKTTGCLGCHSIRSETGAVPPPPLSQGGDGSAFGAAGEPAELVAAGLAAYAPFIAKAAAEEKRLEDDPARAGDAGKKAQLETIRGLAAAAREGREALERLGRWYETLAVGTNIEALYHDAVAPLDRMDSVLGKLEGSPLAAEPPTGPARAAARAIYDRWVHNTFAPDLSGIGSKVKDPRWLADWILDPRKHDPETVMPRFRFDRPDQDPEGAQKVADMVAYLLTLRNAAFDAIPGFSVPADGNAASPEDGVKLQVLDDLAFDYLRRDIGTGETRADARLKVKAKSVAEKLKYVGHRLVRRYGCFGCHDGIRDVDAKTGAGTFDAAQPIGTELEGWGIKEAAKLDYGNWGHQPSGREAIGHTRYEWAHAKLTDTRRFDVLPAEQEVADDQYAYAPTDRLIQKTPDELLKMPLFPFVTDEQQVDAVVTFLAGLVKDRIPKEKIHEHTPEERALEEGSRLIAKLNCAGCHRIGAEPRQVSLAKLPRFTYSFNYDNFEESRRRDEFEKETWLSPVPTLDAPAEKPLVKLEAEKVPYSGTAGVVGEPGAGAVEKTAPKVALELPKGTLLNRKVFDRDSPLSAIEAAAGVVDPDSETRILGHFDLKRLPEGSRVLRVAGFEEGRIRSYFGLSPPQRSQAPPPLVREGERVRGDWLFDFLLDVKPLRPWLKVRMPSFYLSDDEARTLVRWFRANADLPEASERFPADDPQPQLAATGKDLFGVTVGDRVGYQCNSCHPAGESEPTLPILTPPDRLDYRRFKNLIPQDSYYVAWRESSGEHKLQAGFADRETAEAYAKEKLAGQTYAVGDPWDKAKWGPDLGLSAERLRPAWLQAWIIEPQDFMPGTNMPAFFGGRDPVDGITFREGGKEKIDALVRYLVHMKSAEIAAGASPGAAPPSPAPAGAGAKAGGSGN